MPFVEVIRGVWRKIIKVDGSIKPMGGPNTTVPAWVSTPPYDPLNGEILVGVDGTDRVNLAADGKIYPPLCSGGYPPAKTNIRKASTSVTITEIPGGGANLGVNGSWWVGYIVVPPTATLTKGGVSLPAPGITITIPVELKDQQTWSSGVTSSWFVGWPVTDQASTITSR